MVMQTHAHEVIIMQLRTRGTNLNGRESSLRHRTVYGISKNIIINIWVSGATFSQESLELKSVSNWVDLSYVQYIGYQ